MGEVLLLAHVVEVFVVVVGRRLAESSVPCKPPRHRLVLRGSETAAWSIGPGVVRPAMRAAASSGRWIVEEIDSLFVVCARPIRRQHVVHATGRNDAARRR